MRPTTHKPSTTPLSRRRELTRELAISYLMQQAVENPGVLSLAAGLVDPATLPAPEVAEAVAAMMSSPVAAQRALQYGTTQGAEHLRELIVDHFSSLEGVDRGNLGIDAQRVVVTTGSQQLLSLVCETLFDPDDICLVAGPTYFVFAGNLAGVGAEAVTVEADDDGLVPAALDAALADLDAAGKLPRVKMIYLVSYYDNPSGACLTASRRAEIVRIAERWSKHHEILILEDAAYRELRYDGPIEPSVWSFDTSRERVIYTQTFSKTFSPGVRVGFGIVPSCLVEPICDRKGNEDFGSSNFNQHLIATVLKSGAYKEHLETVKASYRKKRDAMLKAAETHMNGLEGVSWRHPHGGLYVWLALPADIDTGFDSPLFQTAVEEGMMYVPGELCYAAPKGRRPHHEMRLSFGVQTVQGIDKGMQRLASAIRRVMTSDSTTPRPGSTTEARG